MGIIKRLFASGPDREERRARYWQLLQDLQRAEEQKEKYGYYTEKGGQVLAQYCTCLIERIEDERPDVLPDLAEEIEKLLPAVVVLFARQENEQLPNMPKWNRRYIIRLLSCIDVHARQNIGEAVRRIEAAAGADLVNKERFYIWIESGAAFIPPECPRPAELQAE